MSAAHTPGPWSPYFNRSEVSGVHIVWSIDSAQRISICGSQSQEHLGSDAILEDECRANARLIAAAPELLDALQSIADCCDEEHAARDYASRQTEIRGIARAAIAKAGGSNE